MTSNDTASLPEDLRTSIETNAIYLDTKGAVQVYVQTTGTPLALVGQLQALGMSVERVSDDARVVQGMLDIGLLSAAASLPGVGFVRPPDRAELSVGSKQTEGDAILLANTLRSTYGVDGAGVKVGVLSDGAFGLSTSQASGDLAAVDVNTCDVIASAPPGQPANATDPGAGSEAIAMAEIVHDLAPGAQIMIGYFGYNTSTATTLDFMAAVNCLAQQNDIVVDDIGFFNNGLYDGTSPVSANAANALANMSNPIRGYYTAVANMARQHYEGAYVDVSPANPSDNRHAFSANSTTTDQFALGTQPFQPLYLFRGDSLRVFLQWDDAFGASANDYNLYLYRDSDSSLVAQSTNAQTGSQNPAEFIAFDNKGSDQFYDIVITKASPAAGRTLDMFIAVTQGCVALGAPYPAPCLNYNTASSSIPNNSDAGGGVLSLGAIDAADPGNDDIEAYSSIGPTNDGRTKPDAAAIDGVAVTGAGGFPTPFFGTSAAAPHAAAIAALILSCKPSLKAGEQGDNPPADRAALRAAMLGSAVDLGAPGVDNTSGAGRLSAAAAAAAAGCPPDGDADGVPDATDNCPNTPNADQLNTDSAPIVTAGVGPADVTIAMSDAAGDACDTDDDNDGILDVNETAGCNGSGPLNPLAADTDGDRVIDGAECALGSNPGSAASRPAVGGADTDRDGLSDAFEASIGGNPNNPDSDGDGITDGVEYKGYGTSPIVVDSDGDGCSDGREIASVDANKLVNSTDLLIVASNFGQPSRPNLDINKNGAINSADLLLVTTLFNPTPC